MPPRRLSTGERAVWGQVAATITPLAGKAVEAAGETPTLEPRSRKIPARAPIMMPPSAAPLIKPTRVPVHHSNNLDANWDKRLANGMVSPDRVVDLHGDTLSAAHLRLTQALSDAVQQGDRLILLVTGKSPHGNARLPPASRGVIRQSISDWLAASSHAANIAAVRNAHPRHGGAGALYLIIRRRR